MTDVSLITALSVLPPPPRYPTQAAYNAAVGAGHIPPMIETNNILSNPEDHFLVGEGEHSSKPPSHFERASHFLRAREAKPV